jgi:hypothetical protein
MNKRIFGVMISVFLIIFLVGVALAQHGHDHGGATSTPRKGTTMANGFAQSLTVEGWKVSFEVMSMGEHMRHVSKGSNHSKADHTKSHSIMVSIQDTASKEIISDAKVTYNILSPSGGKESGKLEWSGDHYGGGFSPKEKGAYQVQLMIESGGMEREAKFIYGAK